MKLINYKVSRPFSYGDYREWLTAILEANLEIRGLKRQIAQTAGCSPAYLSQVLNDRAEFTRDHLYLLGVGLELSSEEIDFLLLLLERVKSKSPQYLSHISERIESARNKANSRGLDSVAKAAAAMDAKLTYDYYSHWAFAAVHLYFLVYPRTTLSEVAEQLNVSLILVESIVAFLQSSGLVSRQQGKWVVHIADVNIPSGSNMSFVNHLSWRHKAVADLDRRHSRSYHFSSAIVLSRKDHQWLKAGVTDLLNELRTRLRDSKNEEIVCLNIDLFSLIES